MVDITENIDDYLFDWREFRLCGNSKCNIREEEEEEEEEEEVSGVKNKLRLAKKKN